MTDVLASLRSYRDVIRNGSTTAQIAGIPLYYGVLESLLMGQPPVNSIVSLAANYTATDQDSVILLDATAAPRTLTLPPAANLLNVTSGTTKILFVKKTDATANAVTIVANVADTIEGAASVVLDTAFASTILVSDGNDWYEFSTGGGAVDTSSKYYAAKGWSGSAGYAGAAGTCQGSSAGFAASVTCRVKHLAGTGQTFEVLSCRRLFIGGGWGLGFDGNRAKMYVTRGDETKLENFVNANWDPEDSGNDMSSGSLLHLGLSYDGANSLLYVNGRQVASIGLPNFLAEPSVGVTFGMVPIDEANLFDGAIVGASFKSSAVTANQMFDHYLACVDANDHVDGGASWTNRWSFNGLSSAPATLEDLAGSVDLTREGSLTIENLRGAWYRR